MLALLTNPAPQSYKLYQQNIQNLPLGLNYLIKNAEPRKDFEKILPNTQSIILLALPYLQLIPISFNFPSENEPSIALFAQIPDYHHLLKSYLKKLENILRQSYNLGNTRICVDSAPVLERDLALQANLGIITHNRMLTSTTHGSFLLLGELFSDQDLSPLKSKFKHQSLTPPHTKCPPDCFKCVKACPTKALTKNGYDPSKCIAYLTTQHKQHIDEDLIPKLKNKLWGCDNCQLCCPFNKQPLQKFQQRLQNHKCPQTNLPLQITLEKCLQPPNILKKNLKNTSLKAASPKLLTRNACYIIANTQQQNKYKQHLLSLLNHEIDDEVKKAILYTLNTKPYNE